MGGECGECGECGAERWFPVRVNVEQLVSGAVSRGVVCVSARRRVRWLQRRVCATWRLPRRVLLQCGGHVLPPDEPLAVLARGDTVTVLPWPDHLPHHHPLAGPDRAPTPDSHEHRAPAPSPGLDRDTGTKSPPQLEERLDDASADESRRSDALEESKRRALRQLERMWSENGAGEDPETTPRDAGSRRRRVRRRRRVAPHSPDGGAPSTAPTPSRPPSEDAPLVLRNGHRAALAPRLVRPLHADAP